MLVRVTLLHEHETCNRALSSHEDVMYRTRHRSRLTLSHYLVVIGMRRLLLRSSLASFSWLKDVYVIEAHRIEKGWEVRPCLGMREKTLSQPYELCFL